MVVEMGQHQQPLTRPLRLHYVELTDRDRELLMVVGENGLALLEQLWLLFWQHTLTGGGGKLRTCRERLAKLERANYLSRSFLGVQGRRRGELAFSLTQDGLCQLPRMCRDRYQVGLPSAHEQRQQIMALDARIALVRMLADQGREIVLWSSERVVRGEIMSATLAEALSRAKRLGKPLNKLKLAPGEIPDVRVLVRDKAGNSEELDLELDGQYTGQALVTKLEALARLKNRVLYCYYDQHGRAGRLQATIDESSEKCRQKIELVGITYGPDPADPYGARAG